MNERKLQSFDDLFGDKKVQEAATMKQGVALLKLSDLDPFHQHPFRLYEGKRLEDMIQSIQDCGVLTPIIVRKKSDGRFETLSGHNRINAAMHAGLEVIPAVVKENLTDDEATLIVTETNLMQRSFSELLPSEKAKALKVHHEALSHQGARTDLISEIKNLLESSEIKASETSSQVANKSGSLSKVGDSYDLSKDTVARYIRLNYLNPLLLDEIDEGRVAFMSGVALSFLNEKEQKMLIELKDELSVSIDLKMAKLLKQYADNKTLTSHVMTEILGGDRIRGRKKNTGASFKIKKDVVAKYFDPKTKESEIESVIAKALELYFQNQEC